MDTLIFVVIGLMLTVATGAVVRFRPIVSETTLVSAWGWCVLTAACWLTNWLTTRGPWAVSQNLRDTFWYGCCVLAVCPLVAVLGAKRPNVRAWTGFVVVPLICVFCWPLLTSWLGNTEPPPLQIETPLLLGLALVTVMGCGNYLGTRFSGPAFLWMLSIGCLMLTFADTHEIGQSNSTSDSRLRTLSAVAAAMTVFWSVRLARQMTDPSDEPTHETCGEDQSEPIGAQKQLAQPSAVAWDLLWIEFRDLFGVVWAKRCQERINQSAEKENWSARLEFSGLEWQPGLTTEQQADTLTRIDHTFRWLLRRFVDPSWIDRRCPPVRIDASSKVVRTID